MGCFRIVTPASLNSCECHVAAYVASSITQSSSNVSQWNDISGKGLVFTQATGTLQPVYTANVQNGLPAINFNGHRMSTTTNEPTSITGNANFTIYCVADPFVVSSGIGTAVAWGDGNTALTMAGLIFGLNSSQVCMAYGSNTQRWNPTISANTWYYVSTTKTAGAINTTSDVRINGTTGTSTSTSTNTPNITTGKPIVLGTLAQTTTDNLDGYLGETAIYSVALSSGQRDFLDVWSKKQWGL